MGPEDKSGYTLYMDGAPIVWGEIKLSEITLSEEAREPGNGLPREYMGYTLYFKIPKRWRCKSRKRFIKLMMSEGISRNYAEWLADFTRGMMPYREAWGNYLIYSA